MQSSSSASSSHSFLSVSHHGILNFCSVCLSLFKSRILNDRTTGLVKRVFVSFQVIVIKTIDLKRKGNFQNAFFGLYCHPVDPNRHNLYLMPPLLSVTVRTAMMAARRELRAMRVHKSLCRTDNTSCTHTYSFSLLLSSLSFTSFYHTDCLQRVIFSIWGLTGHKDKFSLAHVIMTLKG